MAKWKGYRRKIKPQNLRAITMKYCSDYRKHRFELVGKPKKITKHNILHEDLAFNPNLNGLFSGSFWGKGG